MDKKELDFLSLKEKVKEIHPYDVAKYFEKLETEYKKPFFDMLNDEQKSELLTYLKVSDALDLFTELNLEEKKDLIELMDPDDAVDIIEELPKEQKSQLLDILEDKDEYIELLSYKENQAGSFMTTEYIALNHDLNASSAIKVLIKNAASVESIHTLFVIDSNHKYLGVVPFKKLLRAKDPLLVSDLMEPLKAYKDKDEIEEVVKGIKHYAVEMIGIVNEDNILLGIVTIDDAFDIYQIEAQEDFEKLMGLPESREENFLKTAFHRIFWLLILLAFSIPIAFLTTMFEEVLVATAILALFQPLILDAGGDVATQTLAVTLISINNPQGNPLKNGRREILTGVINGFVMGILAFIATLVISFMIDAKNPWILSVVVSLSLFITVFIGPVIGLFVPVTLKKLKFDPAVASGPFITTLIDVLSLLVYFGLATLLL